MFSKRENEEQQESDNYQLMQEKSNAKKKKCNQQIKYLCHPRFCQEPFPKEPSQSGTISIGERAKHDYAIKAD